MVLYEEVWSRDIGGEVCCIVWVKGEAWGGWLHYFLTPDEFWLFWWKWWSCNER